MRKGKDNTKSAYIRNFTGLFLFISITIASVLGLIAGRSFNRYHEQEKYMTGDENNGISTFESRRESFCGDMKSENFGNEQCHSFRYGYLHVDVKNVDSNSALLDSEERIINTMKDVLNRSDQGEMASHKCSSLEDGISCIGFLSDSHLIFRTRSEKGSITLSLFARGPRKKMFDIFHGIRILFKPSYPASIGEGMQDISIDWTFTPCRNISDRILPSPKLENKKDVSRNSDTFCKKPIMLTLFVSIH